MKNLIIVAGLIFTLAGYGQDTTGSKGNASPLTFSGYVEGYYAYDFSQPANNQRPAFFYSHNRNNEFNINLAYIKATYSSDRLRSNLALAAGTYVNANYAAEPGVLKNLYEANAGYKLFANKDIWMDIGIMSSHIGFESAQSLSCWTLTRSMGADNSPYYESGIKLSYTADNGKWLLSAMALNGWQRIQRVEGNSLMSWGTQAYFKPDERITLNYSTFFGTDKPDSARKWRYYHNFYGMLQLTPALGLSLGFDYGLEQKVVNGSDKSHWYAPVAIFRVTPNDHWSFAVRGESYHDKDAVIIQTGTSNGFQTTGFSANIDYWPSRIVAVRVEGKILHNTDAIFSRDGMPTENNTAITFSTAISF